MLECKLGGVNSSVLGVNIKVQTAVPNEGESYNYTDPFKLYIYYDLYNDFNTFDSYSA